MYKEIYNPITNSVQAVLRMEDAASIPFDPANTDYAAYLNWLAEGDTPLPADDQTGQNTGNP